MGVYKMVGNFSFVLKTKRVQYEFHVNRKIMRVTGDSAVGKSEMIRVLLDLKSAGVSDAVTCKYPYEVLSGQAFGLIDREITKISESVKRHDSKEFSEKMRDYLEQFDNYLFFADEDFSFLGTDNFALFCKYTDSFFVLICRDPLCKLPYSYTEIYTVKKSGKFHTLVPVYKAENFMAINEDYNIVTEDSNAGYQFFSHFYTNVRSANGKSNFINLMAFAFL